MLLRTAVAGEGLRADPGRPRVLHDVHSAQQRTDPLHPANLSARHSRP